MMNKPLMRWVLAPAIFLILVTGCNKESTVVPAPDGRLTVNAGSSLTIQLSGDSVELSGSAKDVYSRIVSYLWSEISGPNSALFVSKISPSTWVKHLTAGTYVFELTCQDSVGETGEDTVSVNVANSTFTLNTGDPHFEMHYMGNPTTDYSDRTAPELDAAAWTVDGVVFYIHGAFEFDMSALPANVPVKSALLSLYSNHEPDNGDLVHANSGPENAFYIQRINSPWDPATATWATQPSVDPANRVLIPQTDSPFLDLVNVDVTAMVNTMISSGNYGFKLQLQNEVIFNSRIFYSSSCTDSTKHPMLVVSY